MKELKISAWLAGALTLSAASISCGGKQTPPPEYGGEPDAADATAEAKAAELPEPTADCVDTAVAAGDFATLVGLVQAAGLVETLKGPGPFTIFAPTDAAFAELPEGTLNTLLLPDNQAKLASILKYHVVAGQKLSTEIVNMSELPSLEGPAIEVSVDGGSVSVSGATVSKPDVLCTNGVIHVVDAVMMPPEGSEG